MIIKRGETRRGEKRRSRRGKEENKREENIRVDGLTKQCLFNAQLLYWFCYYSVGHCSYIYLFSFCQLLCIVATILQYIGFVTIPTVTTSVSAAAVPLSLLLLMLLLLWLLLMLQRPSVKWVLGCCVHENDLLRVTCSVHNKWGCIIRVLSPVQGIGPTGWATWTHHGPTVAWH